MEAIGTALGTSSAREVTENILETTLNQPFSVPEMDHVLKFTHNSAAGITGLSYQIIKLLPPQAREDLFRMMHRMWKEGRYVPDFWKRKGLHGLVRLGLAAWCKRCWLGCGCCVCQTPRRGIGTLLACGFPRLVPPFLLLDSASSL